MRYLRIAPDAQSQSILIHILKDDGTANTSLVYNTSGLAISYRRDNGSMTSITLATLASATASYSSGGFVHVSNGVYRLDVPDAALANSASRVAIIAAETTDIRAEQTVIDLDVATSTRSTYAGGDTSGTTTLLSRLSATRASSLDNLALLGPGDLNIPTSGLVACYRSDIGLASIASRVTGWTDQSGSGNDATQSTSTKRMLRDFATPTSLWAEYAASGSPSLDVPSGVSHSTQAVSIFMVVAPMFTTPVTGGLPGTPMTNWYANLYTGTSLGFNLFYGFFSGSVTGPGLLRGGDASDRVDSGLKLLTSPQVVGIVGTSSNVRFHVGDQTATATGVVSGGALPSATVNGGTIGAGGAVATTGPFAGEYRAVLIYNRAVTTTESDQIIAALSKQFAVPTKGRRVVLDGDSIALCVGAGGWLDYVKGIESIERANCAIPTGSFTGTLWHTGGQDWPMYNLSTTASGRVDAYRDTQAESVLCVAVGTNDLVAGVTPANAFAALQTYCAARRAAGWRKIVVAGLTARTAISWANVSAFNALLRDAYNAGTAEFDIFADTELDPLLCSEGADLNTEIFFDGTHFSQSGKRRMAAFMQPFIAQAFGATNTGDVAATINLDPTQRAARTAASTAATQATSAATNTTDLPSMIETSGGHKRFKGTALEEAPTGGGTVDQEQLNRIEEQTAKITTSQINVVSGFADGTLALFVGCSYSTAGGNAISIPKPQGASWPSDLSDWTVELYASLSADTPLSADDATSIDAFDTALTVTGATNPQSIRIDAIAATDTEGAAIGRRYRWEYQIRATKDAMDVPLVSGTLVLVRKIEVPA